jgi:hypothetical protein
MRNKFIVSILLFAVAAGSSWPQFYKDYSETERKSLAEAYYLAGAQYVKVGKADLGKGLEDLAYRIFPALEPSQIQDQALPSAEYLLAQGMAGRITAPETAATTEKANQLPRSFFLRYLGAILDGDAALVSSFFEGTVYVDSLGAEISQQEIRDAFEAFFTETPLKGVEPSSVYDLDSIVIVDAPASMRSSWGTTSILRVTAKMDFSAQLVIWEKDQQVFAHKVGDTWRIFAIGQNPPALTWRPAAASAVQEKPEEPAAKPAPDMVKEAFTACVSAFLEKNLDGTLAYMAQEVNVIRMHQSVTRDEIRTTFEGYLDSTNIGGMRFEEAVDASSIFVEPSKDFAGQIDTDVYALNVRAKVDLSDTVPFWTTYQRYYFVQEDGAWKIFAVF